MAKKTEQENNVTDKVSTSVDASDTAGSDKAKANNAERIYCSTEVELHPGAFVQIIPFLSQYPVSI